MVAVGADVTVAGGGPGKPPAFDRGQRVGDVDNGGAGRSAEQSILVTVGRGVAPDVVERTVVVVGAEQDAVRALGGNRGDEAGDDEKGSIRVHGCKV
jgi:hypothetical protein